MNNYDDYYEILETITPAQWRAIETLARAMQKKGDTVYAIEVKEPNEEELYTMVTRFLHEIGCPANLKGYNYLKEAVVLVFKDRHYIEAMTKELYPYIAKVFSTTPSKVERAIRHAMVRVFDSGDIEILTKVFTYKSTKDTPTNGEAIASIVEYLKNI